MTTGLCWVLDSHDDVACIRALTALHSFDARLLVCHPPPGATWPVLVGDLLHGLGKHHHALARERGTRAGTELLRVWLRAEQIRHLVLLRAHLLRPGMLAQLAELAAAAGVRLWPVWHHPDPPPTAAPSMPWQAAAAALRADARQWPAAGQPDAYAEAFAAARIEARRWQPPAAPTSERRPSYCNPPIQHTKPGCTRAALVQRLTIDAATPAELGVRLRAAQAGFTAEGLHLSLPDTSPAALSLLGPRLTPATMRRLRRLVCPATAAAVMLGLATDAEASVLSLHQPHGRDTGSIKLLPGRYRIPPRARPLLRAALIAYGAHPRARCLLTIHGHPLLGTQSLAHLIRRGAALAEVDPPPAARPLTGLHPAPLFAEDVTAGITITASPANSDRRPPVVHSPRSSTALTSDAVD
ncbi:MAG: hypothetical protein ACRDMV_23065 [Streptosporangiales bacterium]